MSRRGRDQTPLRAHERRRAALRAYLRAKVAHLEARRGRIDRLLAQYRATMERMPHPGD